MAERVVAPALSRMPAWPYVKLFHTSNVTRMTALSGLNQMGRRAP
jgi:hypothetical protein